LVEELKSAPEMTDQEVQEYRRQHPDEYVQCEKYKPLSGSVLLLPGAITFLLASVGASEASNILEPLEVMTETHSGLWTGQTVQKSLGRAALDEHWMTRRPCPMHQRSSCALHTGQEQVRYHLCGE
jgi:hypothetical protein